MDMRRTIFVLGAMALVTVFSATPPAAQAPSGGLNLRPAPAPQSTASPDAEQAAKDLVHLMSGKMVSDIVSKMTAQVWPSVETSLRAQNPKLDAATLSELRAEFERLIVNALSDISNQSPAIYEKYFTAQEMRDLAGFYRTPAGAKALAVMPQVLADVNALTMARMQGLQERVNLAFLNILQKRGLYGR